MLGQVGRLKVSHEAPPNHRPTCCFFCSAVWTDVSIHVGVAATLSFVQQALRSPPPSSLLPSLLPSLPPSSRSICFFMDGPRCSAPSVFWFIFCWPSSARWMSVGELAILLLWVGAMASHFWQGAYRSIQRYHDGTGPCPDDPTSKCYLDTRGEPEPAETTGQNRYRGPF